jgi:hypothetical protein
MLDMLREGETVVGGSSTGLSRSLTDVLHIMERITSAGASFRSITENIDTKIPAGRDARKEQFPFKSYERRLAADTDIAGATRDLKGQASFPVR